MTTTEIINHIDESILRAERHQSYIDVDILNIKGFSTPVMRRLWSNICHMPKPDLVYLECGLYGGASFCAAMNHNKNLHAIGVEDFSQDFGDPTIRQHLMQNLERYGDEAGSCLVIDEDFFKTDLNRITRPIDLFFFDGEHSRESQAKALPHIFDKLAETFVFIVDDAHWVPVSAGTADGFEKLKGKVQIEKEWTLSGKSRHDDPIYHNGVFIAVCSKV